MAGKAGQGSVGSDGRQGTSLIHSVGGRQGTSLIHSVDREDWASSTHGSATRPVRFRHPPCRLGEGNGDAVRLAKV
jgi:hypothetical protein